MKHIEVSRKIQLGRVAAPADLKAVLLKYLEKSMEFESTSGDDHAFKVSGTTGSPAGITRHARLELDVSIDTSDGSDIARIIISGHARAAPSLVILYCFAFFLLLVVGLLPGFYETSQEHSGAIDALFFLIFGIFIVYDVHNKLNTTREYLETALESLNTTFG